MDVPPGLVIPVNRPDPEEARLLIGQLDDDRRQRYPGAVIHGLRPQNFADPQLTCLVACVAGHAAGCGAFCPPEPGVGEVKRLCVRSVFRGRGIARQMLLALESSARARGYATMRLGTGLRQPEAIGLYWSAGYVEIPCFGEYTGGQFSVCFEK
jgi:ribosomal protein S18 acetylase RimI-like enzyme